MSAIPKKLLTSEEYLERERKADFKSEFYHGEIFAMSGASYKHTRIKDNLVIELGSKFKGGLCKVLSSDMRVKVPATTLYTYPDVVIICGKPEFEDKHFDTLLNPIVIVEILSPPTAAYDRGAKFHSCQKIASLKQVVFVEQGKPFVESFLRQDDENWMYVPVNELENVAAFPAVDVKVSLADIYAGVDFTAEESGSDPTAN